MRGRVRVVRWCGGNGSRMSEGFNQTRLLAGKAGGWEGGELLGAAASKHELLHWCTDSKRRRAFSGKPRAAMACCTTALRGQDSGSQRPSDACQRGSRPCLRRHSHCGHGCTHSTSISYLFRCTAFGLSLCSCTPIATMAVATLRLVPVRVHALPPCAVSRKRWAQTVAAPPRPVAASRCAPPAEREHSMCSRQSRRLGACGVRCDGSCCAGLQRSMSSQRRKAPRGKP